MDEETMEVVHVALSPAGAFMARLMDALIEQTGSDDDVDYKRLYLFLFNGITLTLDKMKTYADMVSAMKMLQACAENIFCGLPLDDGLVIGTEEAGEEREAV